MGIYEVVVLNRAGREAYKYFKDQTLAQGLDWPYPPYEKLSGEQRYKFYLMKGERDDSKKGR